MKKERNPNSFIKKPIYDGGMKALRAFIAQNKKYPKAALENKIEGTVYVKYTIDYKGKVVATKIVKSLGNGCDEESIRLVKMLKFRVPKNRGIKVKFYKNIQIHFRLPKEKEKTKVVTPSTSYVYTITSSPKKEATITEKKKGGGYTIRIR